MTDTNEDIRRQLSDAQQTLCDHQRTFTELRNENQFLVNDKNALVAEIDLVKREYDSVDAQLKALKCELADTTINCEELTRVVDQKSTELAAMSQQLCQVNKMHIEAIGRAEINANENTKLRATIAKVENDKLSMQTEIETLQKANTESEQSKQKQISELTAHSSVQAEHYKCQEQQLRTEIVSIERENCQLKDSVERLQVELNSIGERVLKCKENNERLSSESIELSREKEQLNDTIKMLTDQKEQLHQDATAVTAQLEQSQRMCTELTAVNQNQDQTYRKQLESIAVQRSELECRAKMLSDNLSDVTTELHNLKQDHIHVNKLNAQLTTELESLAVDHKQAIESAADNCRTLTLKSDTTIADLNAERDTWTKCRLALERELCDAKDENSRLTDASSKLNLAIGRLDVERTNLSGELEAARQECQTSKKIAEDLQIKWKRLEVEIRENQQKSAQLEAQVKQLTGEREQQAMTNDAKKYEALCQTEKDLSKAVAILQAKLIKHRENSVQQQKDWNVEREKIVAESDERVKEVRIEMEGKLEKMKAKMVSNRCDIN